ncbi:hypothetical protein Tco_1260270 [Tanacetum coccineum]
MPDKPKELVNKPTGTLLTLSRFEEELEMGDEVHRAVHDNLVRANSKYKQDADQKRRHVDFEVSDFVWAVLTKDHFPVDENGIIKGCDSTACVQIKLTTSASCWGNLARFAAMTDVPSFICAGKMRLLQVVGCLTCGRVDYTPYGRTIAIYSIVVMRCIVVAAMACDWYCSYICKSEPSASFF